MKRTVLALTLLVLLAACGRRAAVPAEPEVRHFLQPTVPGVITSPDEVISYLAAHWWDSYLAGTGVTDSAAVLGVPRGELESAVSDYIALLDNLPMPEAQAGIRKLFSGMEARQAEDTASLFFLRFSEMVAKYLYDPNSPLRNEDYFLPFVSGLAGSLFTREDMRAGYAYQARMCSLNQFGQIAPDFRFKDAGGRLHSLHGVKADLTVLFFSNPGCNACKDIIAALGSRPYLSRLIAEGRLAVLSIYIDNELDKWREHLPEYPSDWIRGYDHLYRLRDSQIYDIRAIPSLYLLGSGKEIIMKDAPTERLLGYLDRFETTKTL